MQREKEEEVPKPVAKGEFKTVGLLFVCLFKRTALHKNCDYKYLRMLFNCHAVSHVSKSNSPPAQNSEAMTPTAGGSAGHRSTKEQSARRRDDTKQAAKKPKENALSQFDLNNYASK